VLSDYEVETLLIWSLQHY